MKKILIITITLSILVIDGCSNRQNSISPGGVIGGALGATTGAAVGGMFGLMIAGSRSKNTDILVAAGAILGALSVGSSGYNLGKLITK